MYRNSYRGSTRALLNIVGTTGKGDLATTARCRQSCGTVQSCDASSANVQPRAAETSGRARTRSSSAHIPPLPPDGLPRTAPILPVWICSANDVQVQSGETSGHVRPRERRAHHLCNPKKTHDSLFVGQEPRLHGSNGDPETHSRSGLGQVPAKSTWCTFLAVEIAKRKPW